MSNFVINATKIVSFAQIEMLVINVILVLFYKQVAVISHVTNQFKIVIFVLPQNNVRCVMRVIT